MNHSSVVSVGIDVGKAKLDVACVREDRSAIHQVFSNTEKGISSLAKFLKQQRTAVTVPCVLEATGDYHLLAGLMLSEAGNAVKCIDACAWKELQDVHHCTIAEVSAFFVCVLLEADDHAAGITDANVGRFSGGHNYSGSRPLLGLNV
jgi:hypothetical protein